MKKIRTCRAFDYMSNLQVNLIENILIKLPIKEAARTCLLSRSWQHIWKSLPELVFDDTLKITYPKLGIIYSRENMLLSIYQVLLVHQGPILRFALSLPRLGSYKEIYQIVAIVLGKGVKDFTIHIPNQKLPPLLFSCCRLTHLNMRSCAFSPPSSFSGFPNLVSLVFYEVVVRLDTLETLISNCPKLQNLEVEISSITYTTRPILPQLKALLATFILKNVHCLTSVRISSKHKSPAFALEGSRPTTLYLKTSFMKVLLTDGIPAISSHLKDLKLSKIRPSTRGHIKSLFKLISCCPNLEILTIKVTTRAYYDEDKVKELYSNLWELSLDFCKVSEVKILGVCDVWPELEFINLLLGKLQKLEKMYIEPDFLGVRDGGLNMLKRVTEFRRASPSAVVNFKTRAISYAIGKSSMGKGKKLVKRK